MRFALVTNALVMETNCRKRVFKLQPHTDTHVATSDFQTELLLTLLLTGTHHQKRVVATLSYSPACNLHPQVTYAVAFPAGLNALQDD